MQRQLPAKQVSVEGRQSFDISMRYQEIFRNEIDSLMIATTEKNREEELTELKKNIEDACAKGKITELHYTLLKEKLSYYERKGGSSASS